MALSTNANQPSMVVLGDSVVWGQGLQEWNKFYSLVFDQLALRSEYTGLTLAPTLAHSGAIIGAGDNSVGCAAPGEIPDTHPMIIQQCNRGYKGFRIDAADDFRDYRAQL